MRLTATTSYDFAVLAPMEREERRFSTRATLPYAARLWGIDMEGRPLKEDTRVVNISSGGIYLRVSRFLLQGARVFVAARLSEESSESVPALRLVASGLVVRTERQSDGTCGVAVEFTRRRVL
jgi:hypothetical protein